MGTAELIPDRDTFCHPTIQDCWLTMTLFSLDMHRNIVTIPRAIYTSIQTTTNGFHAISNYERTVFMPDIDSRGQTLYPCGRATEMHLDMRRTNRQ